MSITRPEQIEKTELHPAAKGCGFLLALAVAGVAVAWLVMQYADYAETHWTPRAIWVAMVGALGVVLYAVGQAYPKRRRFRTRFWIAMTAVSTLHLAFWGGVLHWNPDLSVLWFTLVTPAETVICLYYLERVGVGPLDPPSL